MKTLAARGRVDPKANQRYHILILGGGTVGLAAAKYAAELGARVAIVEHRRLGGDRLLYALPAARLIRATRAWRQASEAAPRFNGPQVDGPGNAAAALSQARSQGSEAARWADVEHLCDLGIDVFTGTGRFVAADALEVARQRLHFRRALIATGARAPVPKIAGLEGIAYHSPETLLELTEKPPRLGILGAGTRGCEMAQAFARLGSEVHLFERRRRILPRCDPDAAARVDRALYREGVHLHLEAEIQELRVSDGVKRIVHAAEPLQETVVDEVLLTEGQAPNVEKLGLEAAGVDYDLSGVEVGRRLRTTNARIFAAGGVISGSGLDHVDNAARMAVRNALFFRRFGPQRPTVTRAVLTSPEVAWVGLNAEEAGARARKTETLTVPLIDPTASDDAPEGFLKLYLGRRSGRILGGTLVAANAAELIAPLALAVSRQMRLRPFASNLVPYPADGNVYRLAALAWRRRHKSKARALLELWLRVSLWPPR